MGFARRSIRFQRIVCSRHLAAYLSLGWSRLGRSRTGQGSELNELNELNALNELNDLKHLKNLIHLVHSVHLIRSLGRSGAG